MRDELICSQVSPTSLNACPAPSCPPADAGEAEGGQQAEYDPAAECRAQRSAAEGPGGRGRRHQDPGGGAAAASAEGQKHKKKLGFIDRINPPQNPMYLLSNIFLCCCAFQNEAPNIPNDALVM